MGELSCWEHYIKYTQHLFSEIVIAKNIEIGYLIQDAI